MKEGVARPVEAAAFRVDDGGIGHLKKFPWADAEAVKALFAETDRGLVALYLVGSSVLKMSQQTGLTPDEIGERLSAITAALKREQRKRRRKR